MDRFDINLDGDFLPAYTGEPTSKDEPRVVSRRTFLKLSTLFPLLAACADQSTQTLPPAPTRNLLPTTVPTPKVEGEAFKGEFQQAIAMMSDPTKRDVQPALPTSDESFSMKNYDAISPKLEEITEKKDPERYVKITLPGSGTLQVYLPTANLDMVYDVEQYIGALKGGRGIHVAEPADVSLNQAGFQQLVDSLPAVLAIYNSLRPEDKISVSTENDAKMFVIPASHVEKLMTASTGIIVTSKTNPVYAVIYPGGITGMEIVIGKTKRRNISQVGYVPPVLNGLLEERRNHVQNSAIYIEALQSLTESEEIRNTGRRDDQENFANNTGQALYARSKGWTYQQYVDQMEYIASTRKRENSFVYEPVIFTEEQYNTLPVISLLEF